MKDVVIVGAGLGGLYLIHRLRQMGLSVACIERGSGVGGTWFFNSYPGARVDTTSMNYSYSFDESLQQEWRWSERYATQPELLRYINHVADRFALREHITFETSVTSAVFESGGWRVGLSDGRVIDAQFLISAAGVLSATNVPPFEGLDTFRGRWVHTSQWPSDLDVSGKRVGVIGTGSTGVQVIPHLARAASHLDVFQRTANYCLDQKNGPLAPGLEADWLANYPKYRHEAKYAGGGASPALAPEHAGTDLSPEERHARLEQAWSEGSVLHMMAVFKDVLKSPVSNEYIAEFAREKIRALVKDPAVAERLMPRGYPFGTKRLVLEDGYYESFNRDNVTLVDVKADPIERIVPEGVRLRSGRTYPLDVLVLATGFDAITGPLLRLGLVGKGGERLEDHWRDGPRTYLGMATSGFPNLFFLTGPGSPSVLGNMVTSLELHVDWIADLIAHMRKSGLRRAEAIPASEEEWTEVVRAAAARSLYPETDSWYMGANIPGKPRVFLAYVGGVGRYRRACEAAAAAGYPGLEFT